MLYVVPKEIVNFMVKYATTLKDALDTTIEEFEYSNNPRKCELVKYILYHIEKMNVDPFAYEVFSEKNGARQYVIESQRENLLKEIFEVTSCSDKDLSIQKYAVMYSRGLLEKSTRTLVKK